MKKIFIMIAALLSMYVANAEEFIVDSMKYMLTHPSASGVYAIQYLGDYGDVVIPSSVTYSGRTFPVMWIYDECFKDKEYITSIVIPNTVRGFGSLCFRNCRSLTHIEIPNSIISFTSSTINEHEATGAFWGCSSLASINIPDSVTALPNNFFRDCTNLTSIVIPDNCRWFGDYCFSGCTSLVRLIRNSEETIRLGSGCFYNCSNLISITNIGSAGVVGESNGCFENCSSLIDAAIFQSSTGTGALSGKTFLGCSSLRKLDLGFVSDLGGYSFIYEYMHPLNLDTLVVKNDFPATWTGDTPILESFFHSVVLIVPCGKRSIYESVGPWSLFWNIVEDCSGNNEAIDDPVVSNMIDIHSVDGRIYINGSDAVLYGIDGKMIETIRDNQASQILPPGVYMVKVGTLPARKVVVIR